MRQNFLVPAFACKNKNFWIFRNCRTPIADPSPARRFIMLWCYIW